MALNDNQITIVGLMIDAYTGDRTIYREQLRGNDALALSDMAIFVAKRISEINVDVQVATNNLAAAQALLTLFESV